MSSIIVGMVKYYLDIKESSEAKIKAKSFFAVYGLTPIFGLGFT
jgi:hypothetical protein